MSHKKYMLEAEKSSVKLYFARTSRDRPFYKVPMKLSAWRILSVTFLPFTHTIYTFITHKCMRSQLERKTLNKFSTTQYTHLLDREPLILSENHYSLFPSLSHCHTLRGDLYPNTAHTFSKCRECFGVWETLKWVRLGGCN